MGDHGVATTLPRAMRQPSGPFYHEPLDRNQALGDVVERPARQQSIEAYSEDVLSSIS